VDVDFVDARVTWISCHNLNLNRARRIPQKRYEGGRGRSKLVQAIQICVCRLQGVFWSSQQYSWRADPISKVRNICSCYNVQSCDSESYRHFEEIFVAKYKRFFILSNNLQLVDSGRARIFFMNRNVLNVIELN